MSVPMVDLKIQYDAMKDEIDRAVLSVIQNTAFILGPQGKALEQSIAAYHGVKFAVGVASGTDALHLALRAADIGPGDEVITTPFTFIATAEAISYVGAVPVFVDIRPDTFNIDVTQIESHITKRTKAILPVHLYGQAADMGPLMEIAKKQNLKVIEDCAQSFGSDYRGKKTGAFADMGCFSFFPSKNLGCYGDGGMIITDDKDLADRLMSLRNHGSKVRYYHDEVGYNSRLDEIQAAVLTVKLGHLDAWTEARQRNAATYDRLFREAGLAGTVGLPVALPGYRHIYNQYVIRVPDRDRLREQLTAANIGTEIYYPVPFHVQECFASLGYKPGDFPNAERAASEVLALPIYPELTAEQQQYVVDQIAAYYRPRG